MEGFYDCKSFGESLEVLGKGWKVLESGRRWKLEGKGKVEKASQVSQIS
jgi:hypothetical protein